MNYKYCPKCRQLKMATDFSPDKTRRDGLRGHCKRCNARRPRPITEARRAYQRGYRAGPQRVALHPAGIEERRA